MTEARELAKRYNVVLSAVPAEDGGGFYASSPKFPGVLGDGDTADNAVVDFYDALESAITIELERGNKLPVSDFESEQYSGKLSLRLSKSMHRAVADLSKAEGASINQTICTAISYYLGYAAGTSERPQSVVINLDNRMLDSLPARMADYERSQKLWPGYENLVAGGSPYGLKS